MTREARGGRILMCSRLKHLWRMKASRILRRFSLILNSMKYWPLESLKWRQQNKVWSNRLMISLSDHSCQDYSHWDDSNDHCSYIGPDASIVFFSTGDLDDHSRVNSSHQDTWGDYFCQDSSYISRSFKWSFVLRLFGWSLRSRFYSLRWFRSRF